MKKLETGLKKVKDSLAARKRKGNVRAEEIPHGKYKDSDRGSEKEIDSKDKDKDMTHLLPSNMKKLVKGFSEFDVAQHLFKKQIVQYNKKKGYDSTNHNTIYYQFTPSKLKGKKVRVQTHGPETSITDRPRQEHFELGQRLQGRPLAVDSSHNSYSDGLGDINKVDSK
ncbi:hypothetical protein PAXINDRAFT_159190, partial [Paxillus involutus ATCC 200175]